VSVLRDGYRKGCGSLLARDENGKPIKVVDQGERPAKTAREQREEAAYLCGPDAYDVAGDR
jgi:hypothetical protein